MANVFRDFSREDWYGYAGAENFADGTPPKISEEINDSKGCWVILVDKNGIQVDFLPASVDDADQWMSYTLLVENKSKELLIRIGEHINPVLDDLEALGFERIA